METRKIGQATLGILLGLWATFFAISCGLGYASLRGCDARTRNPDAGDYYRIAQRGAFPQYRGSRVLIPFLARGVGDLFRQNLGSWNATAFGFLVVNSAFMATAAVLTTLLASRITVVPAVPPLAGALYLMNFTVVNLFLVGLVDSAGAAAFAAIYFFGFTRRLWPLLIVFPIAAAAKESDLVLLAGAVVMFALADPFLRKGSAIMVAFCSLLLGLLAVSATIAIAWGHLLSPLELFEVAKTDARLGVSKSFVDYAFSTVAVYIFGWLLPLSIPSLRLIASPLLRVSFGNCVFVSIICTFHYMGGGNGYRPLFAASAPVLCIAAAMTLSAWFTNSPEEAPSGST